MKIYWKSIEIDEIDGIETEILHCTVNSINSKFISDVFDMSDLFCREIIGYVARKAKSEFEKILHLYW
jgi:hypothetical protein